MQFPANAACTYLPESVFRPNPYAVRSPWMPACGAMSTGGTEFLCVPIAEIMIGRNNISAIRTLEFAEIKDMPMVNIAFL